MATALQLLHPEKELNPQDLLIETLKTYPEKTVHPDKTVTTEHIETDYFLDNDTWEVDFFFKINQFQSQETTYKGSRKKFSFTIENDNLKLEFKYLMHYYIFQDRWGLSSWINGQQTFLRKLFIFLNEQYPSLNSLLDLDIEEVEKKWLLWLTDKGVRTTKIDKKLGSEYICFTPTANILRNMYDAYFNLMDTREEFEKDKWDIRNLNQKYGIEFNESQGGYYIDFTNISNVMLKNELKRYCKQRLLSRNQFSVASAINNCVYMSSFFNFITELEPEWNDLKGLNRQHIEQYIVYLNEYTKMNLKRENSNPKKYICESLTYVNTFLSLIQKYEYEIAPIIPVGKLIYPEDKPKIPKKSADQIDYIPDFVLRQLFKHINDLHPDVVPIVYVAFKSGLRICDVLDLKTNCLVRLKEKYYIQTKIQKTQIENHRIPIDDELAKLLTVEIKQSKELSNQDNNPNNLIFIRYRGSRKGYPYSQVWVRQELNKLGHKCQIKDENGNLFWFKMHQFRHTYGVKLINNGGDIKVVQQLLGHFSPEMTLTYAKVLDETKRKQFDEVISKGVFTFDDGNQVIEYQPGDDIPQDILDTLYLDHQLTAMDNPYGTCHARLTQGCPFMDEPPCLTCEAGKPCQHLAIGFSEHDTEKYELLVKTTSKSIGFAEEYGRDDLKEKSQKNLKIYQSILSTLQKGEIIFGNLDSLEKGRLEALKRGKGA